MYKKQPTAQQLAAYTHLKDKGELDNVVGHRVSEHEIYIYIAGGDIIAIHSSGIVTKHMKG